MKNQIHTSIDLLKAAAAALGNRDSDTLYDLIEVVEGWMIDGEEARAYKAVLDSMIEAIDQMAE